MFIWDPAFIGTPDSSLNCLLWYQAYHLSSLTNTSNLSQINTFSCALNALTVVLCVCAFTLYVFSQTQRLLETGVHWRPAFIWDPAFIRTRASEPQRLLEAGVYLRIGVYSKFYRKSITSLLCPKYQHKNNVDYEWLKRVNEIWQIWNLTQQQMSIRSKHEESL